MKPTDIIPTLTKYDDEKLWIITELIEYLQQVQKEHGNIPVVGRGYEMGMDNLEPEILKLYHDYEGVCGTYTDRPQTGDEINGVLALALGNAG